MIKHCVKSPITYILIAALLYLSWLGFQNTDIVSLSSTDIDAYAFIGVYIKLWNGLLQHSPKEIMAYCFYNYGWVYFLFNTLLIAPFLLLKKWSLIIFIPRLLSILPAIATVAVLYNVCRLALDKATSTGLALLILTMPFFWTTALLTHPDWIMTLFLSLAIWDLFKDNLQGEKQYRNFVVYMGLAIAFKLQGLTFLPLLGACLFFSNHTFTQKIKKLSLSLISILGLYLVINPYLIHPRGLNAFLFVLKENLESNATNHGSGIHVSLIEKIQFVLLKGYYNIPLLILITCLLLVYTGLIINKNLLKLEKNNYTLPSILSGTILLNIGYLFLKVNKLWEHYYASCMVLSVLLLGAALSEISHKKRHIIIAILCSIQIISFFPHYIDIINSGSKFKKESQFQHENSDFILSHIQVDQTTQILISSGLGIDFPKIGLNFDQLHVSYGDLKQGTVDRQAFKLENPQKSETELSSSFITYDYLILKKKGKPQTLLTMLKTGVFNYKLAAENQKIYIFRKID